jgi:hypothetical protein
MSMIGTVSVIELIATAGRASSNGTDSVSKLVTRTSEQPERPAEERPDIDLPGGNMMADHQQANQKSRQSACQLGGDQ